MLKRTCTVRRQLFEILRIPFVCYAPLHKLKGNTIEILFLFQYIFKSNPESSILIPVNVNGIDL